MSKKLFHILNLIITVSLLWTPFSSHATEYTYVNTSEQLYTYEAMVEDIMQLSSGHEDIMSYENLATTGQGRNIYLIRFGNLNADNKILITASIHAREYMSSQLVMRMLEEYVLNFDLPRSDGGSYRQDFDSVCFYILPMINPDGVAISQFGIDGATQELTKNWLFTCMNSGQNLTQIKSNANGVDLNRNFPIGFNQGTRNSAIPSLSYYSGITPFSEIETCAMGNLLNENTFLTCINYHSMGNVIYYGANTNSPDVANGCAYMANFVSSINGYRKEYCGNAIGSFADYFGTVEAAPSVTIEIGTRNPVPISQFTNIYNQNVFVWPMLANLY